MKQDKQKVIDVHTHIFNAAYIPVEGIILAYFTEKNNNEKPTFLQKKAAWAMARLVEHITPQRVAPKMNDSDWISKVEQDDFFQFTLYFSIVVARYAKKLTTKAEASLDEETIIDAIAWICQEFPVAQQNTSSTKNLSDDPARYLASLSRENIAKSIRKFILWLSEKTAMGTQQIRFFFLLICSSPKAIAEYLTDSYSSMENIDTRLFVHHMMDMENAYKSFDIEEKEVRIPSEPVVQFPEQVDKIAEINKEYAGILLGFVAYDPRRKDPKDNALGIVSDAIEKKGFCGVKYYPSMGYLPKDTLKHKKNLFQYCSNNGIPILTHCKPGAMRAEPELDQNNIPSHWVPVLDVYPDLTLCFGHAGAGIYDFNVKEWNSQTTRGGSVQTEYGWFSTDEDQWNQMKYHFAKQVLELCLSTKYKNVYCDFSILSDLLPGRSLYLTPQEAKERLKNVIKMFFENTGLSKHVMYASDWHMPSVLGFSTEYLKIFLEIFSEDKYLRDYADYFFFKNAVRFLRLRCYVERNKDWLTTEACNALLQLCNEDNTSCDA